MIPRYAQYLSSVCTKRKLFSEVQKRIIACRQGYMCLGDLCRGKRMLPETWELDHIKPLFQGGSNFYDFYHKGKTGQVPELKETSGGPDNLQILCPTCHADKTQKERIRFYENERKYKYPDKPKTLKNSSEEFVAAHVYYSRPPCHPRRSSDFIAERGALPKYISRRRQEKLVTQKKKKNITPHMYTFDK